MTVAERVRRAIGEYFGVDPTEIADDRVFDGHMLITFTTIKTGIPCNGTVGEKITVSQLIARFEKMAEIQGLRGGYEETPKESPGTAISQGI